MTYNFECISRLAFTTLFFFSMSGASIAASTDELLREAFHKGLSVNDSDRHGLNEKLLNCKARGSESGNKDVVFAFQGTGAFEPRITHMISSLLDKDLSDFDTRYIHHKARQIFKNYYFRDSKWSGIDGGILTELLKQDGRRKTHFFSFASEESELLADPGALKNYSFRQIAREIKNSVNAKPEGIQSARRCFKAYKLKNNQKLILISHSSGARSVIKFAEYLRKDGVKIDLIVTIDPVKEAHEAIKEVLPQKIGEPARWTRYHWDRMMGRNPDYPYSRVWSRTQPSSLYKPVNVKEHISFFQKDDVLGLKIGGDALRFGIQGSRIHGADENHFMRNQGTGGHGRITFDDFVLRRSVEAIIN